MTSLLCAQTVVRLTPAAEAKRMRASLTIPPVFADTAYVSSH